MSIVPVLMLSLCGWTGPDPAVLVENLSSPAQADREQAAGALEELGRPALPALYKARDADDPDLRRRVAMLIDLIERQRLLRASRVTVDFDDAPLAEVIEAVRKQTGFPVELDGDDALKLKGRRVTLRESRPVAFWEALEQIGAAGGVRHNPGLPFAPAPRALRIPLIAAEGPRGPVDFAGPFRVNLVRIGTHRTVVPVRPPGEPKIKETSSAVLQVFAEPGLLISPNGPLILEEATDDLGQDLRTGGPVGGMFRPPYANRSFDDGSLGILQYPVALQSSKTPGRQVKRLKGVIPLTVIARADGPIVAPLAGSEGRSFSGGGVTLTITGVQSQGGFTNLSLKVQGEQSESSFPFAPGFRSAPLGDYSPAFRFEDHVQVRDDQGRTCRWQSPGPARRGPEGDYSTRIAVQKSEAGPPAEVRYHDVVGAATEVVFDFKDLPLP